MRVIDAINVNDAYRQGCQLMVDSGGERQASRNGAAFEFGPVTTVYQNPVQRVLWDPYRDCNPFFHLFESLWMLAGMNDVSYLTDFNKKMAAFSDDGSTFWGAYGYRWRHFFGFDQLDELVSTLKADPDSRRAMLTMWAPIGDLVPYNTLVSPGRGGPSSKDLPCNLMAKFEIRNGELNMIVFNRSNDMIWGAYGANAVHFSFLQEYMAGRLFVRVGTYWQVSGNFHVYQKFWDEMVLRYPNLDEMGRLDMYHDDQAMPFPLVRNAGTIDDEISRFMDGQATDNPFLDLVAMPLNDVWTLWKSKERARALVELLKMDQRVDWVMACRMWMERRITK